MVNPPYFALFVLGGIFSMMGFFLCHEQLYLLASVRRGIEGLDDLIGFLASGGFWLGCGALSWHSFFKLLGKFFKKIL